MFSVSGLRKGLHDCRYSCLCKRACEYVSGHGVKAVGEEVRKETQGYGTERGGVLMYKRRKTRQQSLVVKHKSW